MDDHRPIAELLPAAALLDGEFRCLVLRVESPEHFFLACAFADGDRPLPVIVVRQDAEASNRLVHDTPPLAL
jgi:hypothetical protein